MNKILTVFTVLTLLFVSCKKEKSIETGASNNGSKSSLLTKVVTNTGSDSSVTIYQYDASGRLIRETTSGSSQGSNLDNDFIIVRNSSGIITQTIQKNPDLSQSGIDSLVRTVNYDASAKRYTGASQPFSYSGYTGTASTEFIYDQSGKVIEEDTYANILTVSLLIEKVVYTYSSSGTDITEAKIYTVDSTGSNMALVSTLNSTYDTKVSPLILSGSEAFALQRQQFFNANNAITLQQTDAATSSSVTYTSAYTYNASNYPKTASVTTSPGNATSTVTYYYQ